MYQNMRVNKAHSSLNLSKYALMIFVLSVFSRQGEALPKNPDTDQIVAVTILSDRAEVTRMMTVKCEKVKQGVVAFFQALPHQVRPKSLRAESDQIAKVVGVSYQPVVTKLKVETPTPQKIQDLQSQLQTSQQSHNASLDEYELNQKALEILKEREGLIKEGVTSGIMSGKLDLKALTKSLDAITQERTQLQTAQLQLDRKIYQHKHQSQMFQSALDQELEQTKTQQTQQEHGAQVSLTCNQVGEAKVLLTYLTAGATWEPEYHAYISTNNQKKDGAGQTEWGVNAIIRQSTGEDWNDVNITLSTAQPNLGDRAPLPASLKIDGYEEKRQKVLTQRSENRDLLQGGTAGNKEPSQVEIDDRGQSFALKIPVKVSVLSHGQPYWFPVSNTRSSSKVSLICTPKLSPYVFRIARFKNPASHPLLAGEVSINFNGEYLGRTSIQYAGSGEPMELTLGVSEVIRISREAEKNKDEEGSILSGEQVLKRLFKTTLKSSAQRTLNVEVVENLPISEVKKIKVSLNQKQTSKNYRFDQNTGLISWDVKLKPRAEESIRFGYQVVLPDDWSVR